MKHSKLTKMIALSPAVMLASFAFLPKATAMPVLGCVDGNITFSGAQALDFASIAPCSATHTVTIDTATGNRTGAGCLSVSGIHVRGQITVNGNQGGGPAGTVLVTIPTTAVINFGGITMTVKSIAMTPGGVSDTFNAKQSETYLFGGVLTVKNPQTAGSYSGSITINASCL